MKYHTKPFSFCTGVKYTYTFNYLGTSHCADMYANKKSDPPQLIEARARIGQLVDKWIHDANYEKFEHIYAKISIDHLG